MKMQSLYADSPVQEQESSTNIRKKVAIAIVILAVCGIGAWMFIQTALRATSGHS
jgi:hypothetical protein